MKQLILIIGCTAFTHFSFAACVTDAVGKSRHYVVKIQRDCEIEDEILIYNRKGYDPSRSPAIPIQESLFKGECEYSNDEKLITCRTNGKTMLSGMQFKLVGDHYQCPGFDYSSRIRYVCIKGCNNQMPKSLTVMPYECEG